MRRGGGRGGEGRGGREGVRGKGEGEKRRGEGGRMIAYNTLAKCNSTFMIAEHLHAGLSVRIVSWLEPQLSDTYTAHTQDKLTVVTS